MCRLFVLFFLFSCSTFCLNAQNLVPNPSFETLRNLPVKENPKNTFEYEPESGYIPYKVNLVSWFAATETTPDLRINSMPLYNECKRKFKNCDKAHTGVNCVGIITSMTNTKVKTYREYVQVQLKEKLRPNEVAYLEFWISKERQAKLVSNNIGCYFSTKQVSKKTKEVLDLKPQFNHTEIVNADQKEWVKISGSFIPDQPYSYLLIGNFFGNAATEVISFKNYNGSPYTPPYAYYLIDDIKVWQDVPEEALVFEEETVAMNTAIELKNIEFEFDKSDLRRKSVFELEKLVRFLTDNKTISIKIQGHTDSFGKEQYNQRLSEERAKTVYQYLIQKGIPSNRLSYQGFGEAVPKVQNDSDEQRSKNRRVEFFILEH